MKRSIACSVALLGLACLISGCAPDGFPEYAALDRLRVLSVVATPPQPQPGQTVQITPVLSDPPGEGAPVTVTLTTCTDPGIARGADPTCAGVADRQELAPQEITLNGPHFTDAMPPVDIPIPATYLSDLPVEQQLLGRRLIVEGTVVRGASRVTFFKRIPVTVSPQVNLNPSLEGIASEATSSSEASVITPGMPLPRPTAARSWAPRYLQGAESGETLTVTWFASQGAWERTRTESTTQNLFTPPDAWTSGASIWVLVVRDGRGGESFQRILLE